MDFGKEFEKYYVKHLGKGSLDIHNYSNHIESSWKVQDLLEAVASRTGVSCLIDCGALVTGLSNIEVAQFRCFVHHIDQDLRCMCKV